MKISLRLMLTSQSQLSFFFLREKKSGKNVSTRHFRIRRTSVSSIIELLHLADNFLEAPTHVIRAGRCPIVTLHILQEAQEYGVDSHRIDAKERVRYEPRANDNDDDRCEEIVEGRYIILHLRDATRKH